MTQRSGERRQGDRRRTDRRRPEPPSFGESLLGALGVGDAAALERSGDGQVATAARWALRGAHAAAGGDSALARVYRIYVAARAAIGLGLVAVHSAGVLGGLSAANLSMLISVAYALQSITLWLLPRYASLAGPQHTAVQRRRQWLITIGVDLLAFSALHMLEPGTGFNFTALLVLPALMAGVMTARLLALGTAAAVTLMLLVIAWRLSLAGADTAAVMLQAALAGLGMFVIATLSGELAARLAREELAARGSLELARQQALLNRLMIEEMVDGVLVIDRNLNARAANPAARALLVAEGLSPPAPFVLSERAHWKAMADAVRRAFEDAAWPEAGRDVAIAFDTDHVRTLRVRVRFTQGDMLRDGVAAGEPLGVLLLEDVRTAEARVRQEKLAAMGRVSAGIAHEIRNPLAAIAQANALLLEDELRPDQLRLARIVADNVQRLKRIVDDVTSAAPGAPPAMAVIDASAEVAAAAAEWANTVALPLGTGSPLRVELPRRSLGVVFDPEYLRRVLINLLDNARRHAGDKPGAIVLVLGARDEATAQLSVFSDSPPIPPEVERHLFEPFFSTRSRGTGLGLYICRELCDRCDASIEYRARPGAERLRNEFLVTMRRAALASAPAPLPFES